MRRTVLPGLGLVLAAWAVAAAGPPVEPKADPKKAAPPAEKAGRFEREAVVEADPVIDDGQTVAEVDFAGGQRKVYVSKLFLSSFDGFARTRAATAEQQAGFRKFTFYVQPALNYTAADAQKAFAARTPVDKDRSRMDLELRLLPDNLRVQARDEINRRYPAARLERENIALVPYSYIEVWAETDAGETRVYANPALPVSASGEQDRAAAGSTPTTVHAELIGTEKTLRAFADAPKLRAVYVVGGFTIRQNILAFSLGRFVQTGLHHLLTGDARWQTRTEAVRRVRLLGDGVVRAVTATPAASSSWVSRDQVKELSQQYLEAVRGVIWREGDDAGEFAALLDAFVKSIMDRAAADREAAILQQQGAFVLDPKVLADLKADTLTELNQALDGRLKARQKELREQEQRRKDGAGDKDKEEAEREFEDADGVKWSVRGTLVVPKSVRLVQFNRASFGAELTRTFSAIKATRGAFRFVEANQYKPVTEPVYLTAVRVILHTHPQGDDKEEEGSVEVVLWAGEAGSEKEVFRRAGIGAGKAWWDGYGRVKGGAFGIPVDMSDCEPLFPLEPNLRIDGNTRFRLEVILTGKNVKWKPIIRADAWTRGNPDTGKPPTKTTPELIEEKESRANGPARWNLEFRW